MIHRQKAVRAIASFLCAVILFPTGYAASEPPSQTSGSIRVPAEWEPQEAIWLQWPGRYEKDHETAFARMANVIASYQTLHILHDSQRVGEEARQAIAAEGGDPGHRNIIWHQIPNDSAWMRDNGPVYVVRDGNLRIQDWQFDAWGGAFGSYIPYAKDNRVPSRIAELLDLPVDTVDIVHERGNLEFNGSDTVILNWSTIGDPNRNPGYTRTRAEADMKKHFGVSSVVMIEGITEGDLTRGHIDGIARFIDSGTVVVPDCTSDSLCHPGSADDLVYDNAAQVIADAGLVVVRDPIEGIAEYGGTQFDTKYINWIVGNGFVIATGFNNPTTDQSAKLRIEKYFPGRNVHVIEMLSSWASGGGAHCHTNDQPAVN